MPNTTGSRITLKSGERLADVVPEPSGRRADVAAFLQEAGFSREAATRSRPPADEARDRSSCRIVLPAGYTVAGDDDTDAPLFDVYTRTSAEPLDRRDIQSTVDTLALWGLPVTPALQQTYGTDLVRVNLVAEQLVSS